MGVAMMVNPGGGGERLVLLAIALTGMAVGLVWIRRITAGDEDLGSSFWRSHPGGGQGSRLPSWPGDEQTTLHWVATRAWVAIGLGSVVAAVAGPIVLTRWERPLEESAALAAALWIAAIMAAITGTLWMLRILARDR
jgi:drug/metabolite transporter (DMT)-like permease